ncbi:MAG: MotA/TolQ/ExbB proton channel family protein [Mediterranea sp.]|jgi:biopolymer transport protein ExbB/TolQ|nr:MotA/TolQ/ExbB proton channel family protein [Mediterranea sp.]
MNAISNLLFWISTGLMVPVIVLLIILFIRSILLTGGFFGQYLSIRKTEKALRESMKGLTAGNVGELSGKLPAKSDAPVVTYIHEILNAQNSPAHIQRLLGSFEIAADKDLALCKMLTKLGPILGLMGTLIPMGPALVGLSSGDIASMAYNMQVAFATTVVGLFVSAVGFVTQQVKQRWYLQDMTHLEFLAGLLDEKRNIK